MMANNKLLRVSWLTVIGTILLHNGLLQGTLAADVQPQTRELTDYHQTISSIDLAQTGKPLAEIGQFLGSDGEIQFVQNETPTKWNSLEFRLKLATSPTVHWVQLDLGQQKQEAKVKPPVPGFLNEAHPEHFAQFDAANKKLVLSIYPVMTFAVWDITVNNQTTSPIARSSWIASEPANQIMARRFGTRVSKTRNFTLVPSTDPIFLNVTLDDLDASLDPSLELRTSLNFAYTLPKEDPAHYYTGPLHVEVYLKIGDQGQPKLLDAGSDFARLSQLVNLKALGRGVQVGFRVRDKFQESLLVQITTGWAENPAYPVVKWAPSQQGWVYNNPMFDYSITSGSGQEQYSQCGAMGDCYPYERSVRPNEDGKFRYSVKPEVKSAVAHSPLVRVVYSNFSGLFDVDSDNFEYNRASESSLTRLLTHLKTSQPHVKINTGLSDTLAFSVNTTHLKEGNSTTIQLDIPIEGVIDPRAQQIVLSVHCNGEMFARTNFSLQQVKVKINHGVDNHRQEELVELFPDELTPIGGHRDLELYTLELIKVPGWKAKPDIRSLTLEFQLAGPWNTGEPLPDVSIMYRVQQIEKRTEQRQFGERLNDFTANPVQRAKWDSVKSTQGSTLAWTSVLGPEPGLSRVSIVSGWQPSGEGLSLHQMDGKMQLRFNIPTDGGQTFSKGTLNVTRVVIGGGPNGAYSSATPLEVRIEGGKLASVVDDFQQKQQQPEIGLRGPFRLGYVVQLNEHDLEVEVQFEADIRQLPQFPKENCLLGPTYGELDCRYEHHQCPEYYFRSDSATKTCTRVNHAQL